MKRYSSDDLRTVLIARCHLHRHDRNAAEFRANAFSCYNHIRKYPHIEPFCKSSFEDAKTAYLKELCRMRQGKLIVPLPG